MSTPSRTLAALGVLTCVTGLIDAASVIGLGHVFTANMTGNVVFLGFALAGWGHASVAWSLLALAGFLVGAVAGGRMNHDRSRLRFSLVVEGALFSAAFAALALGGEAQQAGVIVLLAAGMGVQNAAVRRLAVPDMTTTVLTLTLAGLAADSRLAGGDAPRTGRRLFSIAAMLAGALAGASIFPHGVRWVVLAATGLVGVAWSVFPSQGD